MELPFGWNYYHIKVDIRHLTENGTDVLPSRFEQEGIECVPTLAPNDSQGVRHRLPQALLIGAMKAGTGKIR